MRASNILFNSSGLYLFKYGKSSLNLSRLIINGFKCFDLINFLLSNFVFFLSTTTFGNSLSKSEPVLSYLWEFGVFFLTTSKETYIKSDWIGNGFYSYLKVG